ncbi:helix-turn-helix domain-containing protein [Pedobacter nototheniae]|uniref:helix-turn-helix domain-containing protein n=1 Tax=Pedobacter nototheniae TaxID=2488994 RepID=UPI00103CEC9A|nr:helix-turn-helix transcriptional regulator [Pedobacter nototheniae]
MNTKKCNGAGMDIDHAEKKDDSTFFVLDGEIQDQSSVKKCISHNLKHIRKQKGLTQDAFSKQLGISRPSYASYEEQRAEPPLSVVITLSNLTGIDINTLLTDELREEVLND